MKKTTLRQVALKLAFVAFVLLAPLGLRAQETLTVYDETTGTLTPNKYVPMFGGYFDEYTKSEFVIPANQLSDMDGGTITSLKFYIQTVSTYGSGWSSNQQVFLKEVESTSLSAWSGTADATIVWEGSFTVPSSSDTEFEITFTTPYEYQGGNLLVGIYNTTKGGYREVKWYGRSVTGASGGNNSSTSLNSVSFSQEDFIPKTTFTYTPAATGSCEKPATLNHSNVTATSATLTWTGGSGTYNLEVKGGSYTDWTSVLSNTSLTTTTLSPLDPETQYQIRVQSVCGEEVSGWKTASFPTPCGTITTFPKTYTFETSDGFPSNASTPTTNQLGNCWRNEATVQNGTYSTRVWGTSTSNKKNGSQSLILPDKGNSTNFAKTMLVFPAMNFTSANGYVVSFWIYRNSTGSNPEGFKVYASDCDTIGANAIALGHYSRNYNIAYPQTESASGWYYYETSPIMMTGTVYIIFEGQSYYGNATYVDDVTIKVAPSCFKPSGLEVNNITTQSADLSWTANSGENAWTLYYKKTSDENYTEVSNVTENPYTLPSLDHSSNYQFYVVANCSATDNSEASDVKTFTTECAAISADGYSANFDDYTAGDNVLPLCWSYINTTTYSYYQGYPKVYNYYANSPSNCLYLYSYAYYSGGTTTYDPQPQYAILPEMNDLTGKRITLQARGNNSSSTFKVGTMSDPTDASSFMEITNSENPAAMTASYQEYIFDIPSTTNRYVAIMIEAANSTRTTNGVYIDDIVFTLSPTCYKPTEAHADVADANNATISWTPDARNVAGGSYSILDAEFNVVEDAENLTGTSFALTGLNQETPYTYYVHTNCFNTAENVEDVLVSFTTPADCAAPVLAADAITDITAHNATVTWTGFTSNDEYAVRYRSAAYLDGINEEFNGTSLPAGWAQYSGVLDNVLAGTATLSSATSWYNTSYGLGSYNWKINVYYTKNAWMVTPSVNIPANCALSFDVALTKYNDNSEPPSSKMPDANSKFIVLASNDNMSTWTVLREWNNTGSSDVLNNISNTANNFTIDLSGYEGDDVRVAFYVECASGPDCDLHIDNVTIGAAIPAGDWQTVTPNPTTTSTTLTGLTAETPYEVKVNGVCNGSEEENGSDIRSFTTTVACPDPTYLAYSNVAAHTANLTWNVNSNPTTNYVLTKNGEESNIVVTINEGVASYQLQNLNGETAYTVKVKANCGELDGYSSESNEINFTTQISCHTPTDFVASGETTTSMVLSWTNGSEGQDAWVIAYKKDGDADFTEKNVTTNPYTLGELEDGKTYTLKIRANCGETDGLSQWSSEITHATEASCATPTDITVSDVNGHGATISWTDTPVEGKNYIVMVANENMALNVDFENNSIPSNFTNDANYPWYVYSGTDCSTLAMRSSNNGVNSSTSAIQVTVNVTEPSTLSFDFWSRGEGTSTYWDKSIFYIDNVQQFERGETSTWESYNAPIAVGSHTLKWEYTKDNTTHKTGDCFYVDNIKITAGASAFVEKNPTTATSLVLDDLDPETTYYVKVKGDCGSATSPESDVETFTTPAACNAPTSLTYDDESVTAHTVDLSWTENNGATAWKVVYSKTNINNSEITIDIDENDVTINGTTINYPLTGLDGETNYTVRVKSNCGGVHNDISAESNSTSFTTLPACYPVGDVITSDITAYSVTVHWTDAHNAGTYVIKQGENVLDGTTTPSVVIDAENHTAVISGLEPQHTYTNGTFKVFADCGSEGMSAIGTNVPYFQTEPSCHPVTSVTITGKTTNSVTFTWGDTHTPETYIIKEGEEVLSDVTAPHSVVIDATNHTATISGLGENETYSAGTFKVFADCGSTDGQSAGVNVPAFTTPCSAVTEFPWSENFESFTASTVPTCWDNSASTSSTLSNYPEHIWGVYEYSSNKMIRMYNYFVYDGTALINSPSIELPTSGVYALTFDYAHNATCGNFTVKVSTDNGANFTDLASYSKGSGSSQTEPGDFTPATISLADYAGESIILQFFANANYGSGAIFVDNIKIDLVHTITATADPAEGGTVEGAGTYNQGSNATLTATANVGYAFVNWTLNDEVVSNIATYTISSVSADGNYVAHFVPTYVINATANPADGGTVVGAGTYNQGSNATLTATANVGYAFVNWTLNNEEVSTNPTYTINSVSEAADYVANFVVNSYTITYMDGETQLDQQIYYYNATVTAIDAPTKEGYTFNGWNPTLPATMPAHDITVTAQWTINSYTITATANPTEGGTVEGAGTYEYNYVLTMVATPSEGYYFVNWTKGGSEVSTDAEYSFTVTEAGDYVANFASDIHSKDIEANMWYAIASPVHNNGNNQTLAGVTNLTTGTYDLFGYTEATGYWDKPTTVLEQGKGYIYRRSSNTTLNFVGINNSSVPDYTLSYACTNDNDLKGFNLVGNPYPLPATCGMPCYRLTTTGTWHAELSSYNVPVCEAVLVKTNATDNQVSFTTISAKSATNAPALAFTVSNDEYEDVVYAILDGQGDAQNSSLPKIGHLEPNAPALSIPVGGKNYAIATLGSNSKSFDMAFSGMGDYTISVDANANVNYLHLIDKLTGSDIDLLLNNSYSFRASIGDNASRFVVKLVPGGDNGNAGNFAFWNGTGWTVEGEGPLYVFDALGRKILSMDVDTQTTINKSQLPSTGVYILRLGEKTQKIVVK